MGNAIESALSGTTPASRPGFSDGLGDRLLVAGSAPGERLEVLPLRPELTTVSSFEFALRERAARLANFHHESYARVRQIDRVRTPDERLAIVSDHVEGWRLGEILAVARDYRLELDVNAALSLLTQLVHAVAILHQQARGVAHGALAPERIVVTPSARVVIVEYVLGSALERLELTRERLWRELRVAVPPAAGTSRFDHRADVTALGATALALVLGRPLDIDEYPQRVSELLSTATENHALGGRQPLSKALRTWLARSLQLDFRNSFPSAVEAEAALESLLAQERGYVVAPVALESFLASFERALPPARFVEGRPAPPPVVLQNLPRPEKVDKENEARRTESPAAEQKAERRHDVRTAQPEVAPAAPEPVTVSSPASMTPAPFPTVDRPTEQRAVVARVDDEDIARLLDEAVAPAAPATAAAAPAAAAAAGGTAAVEEKPDYGSGYPGGFESLFGSTGSNDEATEDAGAREAGGTSRRRWLVRIGVGAAALVVLAVGGYLGLGGALRPAKPVPTTGTLVVESRPAGLTVKIDGTARGTTPLKVALPPGQHQLELVTEGEPRVLTISMAAGAQVSQYIDAPAAPVTGRLQISSEPPGAVVFVDGERKGVAPLMVADLSAGTHRVDLQSESGNVQQQVSIEAGMTNSLVVPMVRQSGPVSGWVTVQSPVALEVYEGGQLVGTSQSERILMTAGRHDLELANDTLGFRGRASVQVAGGKTAPVSVQLPKGALNVNAVPWAEVFVDGQRVGETPIGNLALTIGPHEIVFRHPQLGEQRHAVTVTMKTTARVSADLRK